MKPLLPVSLVALLLASCAAPVAQQDSALTSKAVCCKSLSEFSYSSLPLGRRETFRLDASSRAFEFPTGKSYFAAFKLEPKANRQINIESNFNGQLIGQYLHPILTFLNAQHQPVATLAPQLEFVNAKVIPYTVAHMEGIVDVPDKAQYVVVHTGRLQEAPAVASTRPSMSMFMMGTTPVVVPAGGGGRKLERSPTGELKLQLLDDSSRRR